MAVFLVPVLLLLLPPGQNPPTGHMVYHPSTDKYEFVHDSTPSKPIKALGAGLGIAGGYLLFLSPLLSYRVPIGWVIPAPRRLRLHRWVGVLLLSVSLGHAAILPIVGFFQGWLTGIVALVLLASHGALGAWRPPLVRSWGAARYRYLFLRTAWAAFLMVLVHSPGVALVEHYGLRRRIFELLNPLA